jgi:uncharacterized protein (DUF952 family)
MAKCDEGYLCSVCGGDVENVTDSELYLRFVIGLIDPELLHVTPEKHIRCNPALAQFIVAEDFDPIVVEGPFSKSHLDPDYVKQREQLVTRGWYRLKEIRSLGDVSILEFPLTEVIASMKTRAEQTSDRPWHGRQKGPELIYKIVSREQWEAAAAAGVFVGAGIDLTDGYIHFSAASQVRETAAKHFSGQTNLVLLSVDPRKFGDELRWEPSRGGEMFPHLYACLLVHQVDSVSELPLDETGKHVFPEL